MRRQQAHYGETVTDPTPGARIADIRDARSMFPATGGRAYLNTAAVGLASRRLADTYHEFVTEWTTAGFDYSRGERAANDARAAVARLMGADVVIGQREYSSNHFPWRQLADKGYDVRQVPFRTGGLEPGDVAELVDAGTQLVAFSAVQSATGHRSDIATISGLARAVMTYLIGSIEVPG